MKLLLIFFCCCFTVFAESKPNVIFILADDLGDGGLGCTGSTYLETPHLDKMAAGGARFTNGLSAYPTCKPSRAAILSGQYGPRTGVYRVSDAHAAHKDKTKFIVPESGELNPQQETLGKTFQKAGYATAAFGKWHVANHNKNGHPTDFGFDEAYVSTAHYNFSTVPESKSHREKHAADFMTNRALEFMNQATEEGKPFFIYLPYYLIHRPLEAEPERIAHFKNKMKGLKLLGKKPEELPILAAMTQILDDCVGKLNEEVKRLRLEKNTLFVFTSDNGAFDENLVSQQRGKKGDTYEGGLQVPYIFYWPGTLPSGKVFDDRIIGVDLYPTLVSFADIAKPSHPLDGVDLSNLLLGNVDKLAPRNVFCYYPKYARYSDKTHEWVLSWRNVIYRDEYKLIQYPEYETTELFNLNQDPLEQRDLSFELPEKKERLQKDLEQWLKVVDAPKLMSNPLYHK